MPRVTTLHMGLYSICLNTGLVFRKGDFLPDASGHPTNLVVIGMHPVSDDGAISIELVSVRSVWWDAFMRQIPWPEAAASAGLDEKAAAEAALAVITVVPCDDIVRYDHTAAAADAVQKLAASLKKNEAAEDQAQQVEPQEQQPQEGEVADGEQDQSGAQGDLAGPGDA